MKRIALVLSLLLLFQLGLKAQNSRGIYGMNNWMTYWSNFHPQNNNYNASTEILTGEIAANKTLTKRNTYLLMGVVYVTNNAVLTIEPGTVIRGDKESCGTLVITKGAKIMAEGNVTDPIIFTSNYSSIECKPGDWGGLILLGDAPVNKHGGIAKLDFNLNPNFSEYGGTNEQSNSGVLKYVRIEYAGRKINSHKELNGLSLAGVGSATKLDNIQISFSNDDSFECYGGVINMNNVISYRATDDDFDFTQGAQCNITNSLAVRNPFSSDISKSRCFEIDSYDFIENMDFSRKMTRIAASNITLINTDFSEQGLINEAISIQENSDFSLTNSVVSGFESLVCMSQNIQPNSKDLSKITFQNVLVNSCIKGIVNELETANTEIANWYNPTTCALEFTKKSNAEIFMEINIAKDLDYRLKSNSSVVSNN